MDAEKVKDKALKKAKQLVVKTIKNDDIDNLRKIFKSGLPVDSVVRMPGMTPLMVCASEGSTLCLEVIMDYTPDVNAVDLSGRTALHYACRAGNVGVATELMDNEDIEVDKQTVGGMTPLMYAVESGNANMVAECLNHTCSPFAVNAFGEKAVDLAKKFEYHEDENNIFNLVS